MKNIGFTILDIVNRHNEVTRNPINPTIKIFRLVSIQYFTILVGPNKKEPTDTSKLYKNFEVLIYFRNQDGYNNLKG